MNNGFKQFKSYLNSKVEYFHEIIENVHIINTWVIRVIFDILGGMKESSLFHTFKLKIYY